MDQFARSRGHPHAPVVGPGDSSPASMRELPSTAHNKRRTPSSNRRLRQPGRPALVVCRARCGSGFTCDPGFDTIVAVDLAKWVEEAESLLRSNGLWPEQAEERARGVLEDAALGGPSPLFVRCARSVESFGREMRTSATGALLRGEQGRRARLLRPGMRLALAC